MPPLLSFLLLLVLDLSLLISTLSTCLVKLSLPIPLTLLELAEPLSLPLLLLSKTGSFTSGCLLAHDRLTLVLGDLIIESLLSLPCSYLLLLLGCVRERDLLRLDLHTVPLRSRLLFLLHSHLLDVSQQLGLLLLASLLLLKAELFA